MSSYRFCRTDDIGLLVEALNRCRAPYYPDEPPVTAASFKRSIRDLQIWCSSCMVAFSGADPIGVLIGAKRPSATLIHTIAVHPDHVRQGHGRHLLTSLSSKLSILGPPRMVSEVPETFAATTALFDACGYTREAIMTDYVLEGPPPSEPSNDARVEGFVIPVTIDDLAANGLLGDDHPPTCWERSVETLTAGKDDIAGFAIASDERIEAYLLYGKPPVAGPMPDFAITRLPDFQIFSLRSLVVDGGARLTRLLARLGPGTFRFPKVHPAEISGALVETLGFHPVGRHVLYSARARPA